MVFFLGTHQPEWLWTSRTKVPLFVSRRRLFRAKRPRFFRAREPWALDSGGFTELKDHGEWTITAEQYVREVRRLVEEVGKLQWAAIMDWMCEPWILEKTGLDVPEHQRRTIASYLELMTLAPELPWTPVLQGFEHDDYLRHADAYEAAGIDLSALPIVGVGSVCRRQATKAAAQIMASLQARRLRLHGFGFKTLGLRIAGHSLASSDSLAWSLDARRSPPPRRAHAQELR